MQKTIIDLCMVSKKIADHEILSDINISIPEGGFISILGESGSGKSTLTNIIGLLDDEFFGSYKLDGIEVTEKRNLEEVRSNYFGYIFQSYYLIPYLTIGENLNLVIKSRDKNTKKVDPIKNTLSKVGLIEKINSFPNELSGGEQQRIAIARSLVNSPKIIIADEPTGALDSLNKEKIYDILLKLNSEGKTVILITHDSEIAHKMKNKYEIKNGRIQKINQDIQN